MTRGRGLRKGLMLGIYAGVGVAVVRAVQSRRAKQAAQSAPAWPPMPMPLAEQPSPTRGPLPAPGTAGPAALLAEAAVLEAAGVTEGAEVDHEAAQAWAAPSASEPPAADAIPELLASWAPPAPGTALVDSGWGPPPELAASVLSPGFWVPAGDEAPWARALLDDVAPAGIERPDMDAVILAEEAALEEERLEEARLEAERLEAERLEEERLEEERLEEERLEEERLVLARLEASRAPGAPVPMGTAGPAPAEDELDEQELRERAREDALARFAAQRNEAKELLKLHAEREAAAHEAPAARPAPLMAGDLPGGRRYDDRADDRSEAGPDETRPARTPHPPAELPVDDLLEDDLLEDDLLEDDLLEDDDLLRTDAAEAIEGRMWSDELREAAPAALAPEADGNEPPTLEPLVPDAVVADLDEEPAWGSAVGAAAEVEGDDEFELPPLLTAVDDLGLPSLDENEAARRPLMIGDLDADQSWDDLDDLDDLDLDDGDDFDDPAPAVASAPSFPRNANADMTEDDLDDGDLDDGDLDDVVDLDDLDDVAPEPEPDRPAQRRPLMTGDFDDVLPEDPLDDDGDMAARRPLRANGGPRVPLKARRGPGGEQADVEVARPAGAAATPVKAAKTTKAAAPAKAAKTKKAAKTTKAAAPTKAAPATPAKAAPASRTTTKALPQSRPSRPLTISSLPPTVAKTAKKATPRPAAVTATRVSTRGRRPDVLWVEPTGNACPVRYPVKASLSSGIFHVVGGLFYDRSTPDRCYRTPEAAEAEGLRQAKR